MTFRKFLMAASAMLVLASCSSKPASDLYVLRVPEGSEINCKASRTLVIDRPSAPNEYDSKRIAVLLGHNHLSYYTGANWASPFPDQLQDFLSDAFTQRGITVLDNNTDEAEHASTLHLSIQEADVTDINAPVVHLRLTGNVGSARHARFKVNEAIPATENHMPQIVDAYDEAAMHAAATISKAMKLHCSGM